MITASGTKFILTFGPAPINYFDFWLNAKELFWHRARTPGTIWRRAEGPEKILWLYIWENYFGRTKLFWHNNIEEKTILTLSWRVRNYFDNGPKRDLFESTVLNLCNAGLFGHPLSEKWVHTEAQTHKTKQHHKAILENTWPIPSLFWREVKVQNCG